MIHRSLCVLLKVLIVVTLGENMVIYRYSGDVHYLLLFEYNKISDDDNK